jgi:hypothetical protein
MSAVYEALDKKIRTAQIEVNLAKTELSRKEGRLFSLYVERYGFAKAMAMKESGELARR